MGIRAGLFGDEAIFLPKLYYENYENIINIDAVNIVNKIEIGNEW